MCNLANRLLWEKTQKQQDLGRAASHPATLYTEQAWGAGQDEPLSEFPRALRRTLLEIGIEESMANQLIDTGEGEGQMGKGKGKNGNGKGHTGKGKG